jgi:hypothetical protein
LLSKNSSCSIFLSKLGIFCDFPCRHLMNV